MLCARSSRGSLRGSAHATILPLSITSTRSVTIASGKTMRPSVMRRAAINRRDDYPSNDLANLTARLASGAKPSAPMSRAYASVTGAPPMMTLT